MRYSFSSVALATAPLALLAHAQQDASLDMDDVPKPCKTICQPIGTLADKCDTDLKSDIDRDENLLKNQCICTNKSFDVNKIAGLCQDCMHQSVQKSKRDDGNEHADPDDLKDIDQLVKICGFGKQSYDPSQTSLVNGIQVSATLASDISQLTKTFDGRPINSRQASTSTTPQTQSSMPTGGATPTDSGSAMPTGGATESQGSQTPTGTGTNSPPANTNAAGNVAANLAMAGGAAVAAGLII